MVKPEFLHFFGLQVMVTLQYYLMEHLKLDSHQMELKNIGKEKMDDNKKTMENSSQFVLNRHLTVRF